MTDLTRKETPMSQDRPWAAAVEQLRQTVDSVAPKNIIPQGNVPTEETTDGEKLISLRERINRLASRVNLAPKGQQPSPDGQVSPESLQAEIALLPANSPERIIAVDGAISALLATRAPEVLEQVDTLLRMGTGVLEWAPALSNQIVEVLAMLRQGNPDILSRPEVVSMLLKIKGTHGLGAKLEEYVDGMLSSEDERCRRTLNALHASRLESLDGSASGPRKLGTSADPLNDPDTLKTLRKIAQTQGISDTVRRIAAYMLHVGMGMKGMVDFETTSKGNRQSELDPTIIKEKLSLTAEQVEFLKAGGVTFMNLPLKLAKLAKAASEGVDKDSLHAIFVGAVETYLRMRPQPVVNYIGFTEMTQNAAEAIAALCPDGIAFTQIRDKGETGGWPDRARVELIELAKTQLPDHPVFQKQKENGL